MNQEKKQQNPLSRILDDELERRSRSRGWDQ